MLLLKDDKAPRSKRGFLNYLRIQIRLTALRNVLPVLEPDVGGVLAGDVVAGNIECRTDAENCDDAGCDDSNGCHKRLLRLCFVFRCKDIIPLVCELPRLNGRSDSFSGGASVRVRL